MAWALALGLSVLAVGPCHALETDQFASWERPLADATDAVNDKINSSIARALARFNARRRAETCSCDTARREIHDRLYYVLIPDLELWVMNTSTLERIPATYEGAESSRHRSLYGRTSPLDPILWMPPAPTIEIAGVRLGTDKLTHFLGDGAATEATYRHAIERGADTDAALRAAVTRGIRLERGPLGQGVSGVFSIGDLEAAYQGMLFYRSLCDASDPTLVRTSEGWRLARPLDLREFVTPAWDESWQPNVYTPSRWAKVAPVMRGHCGGLTNPVVRQRRSDYAARDRRTPVDGILRELVIRGKLSDPREFSIETLCVEGPTKAPADSDR